MLLFGSGVIGGLVDNIPYTAAKAGHPISFWRFTKYGLIVTFASLAGPWACVWLRYFVLVGWAGRLCARSTPGRSFGNTCQRTDRPIVARYGDRRGPGH